MKKLVSAVLAICALMALSTAALATPAGSIGIYDSQTPGNADRCTTVAGFTTFNMYVVGFRLGSFNGFEASVTLSDPTWNVLSATVNGPSPVCVGSTGNFICGLGGNVNGTPRFTLVTYNMGYFGGPVAPRLTMCIGPANPSSFNPASAGYATAQDVLVPFVFTESWPTDFNDEGCAIVNPDQNDNCTNGLPTTQASFGEVKARF